VQKSSGVPRSHVLAISAQKALVPRINERHPALARRSGIARLDG